MRKDSSFQESNPKVIQLGLQGADKLEVDPKGDWILHTPGGEVHLHKPHIYQESDGIKRAIPGHYILKGKNKIGFHVASYDTKRPLIIDPILSYSITQFWLQLTFPRLRTKLSPIFIGGLKNGTS